MESSQERAMRRRVVHLQWLAMIGLPVRDLSDPKIMDSVLTARLRVLWWKVR